MDYANTLCESVKIISESLLEGLKFDKTIECTIIDDSQRNKGIYVVSDGSVTFTAYSENTSYRNNTSVYVTIPNGDYDNDKIISGKKLKSNSSKSFIYNSPFGSLVDVTGNLVEVNYQSGDLIANLPSTYYSPFYGQITNENYQNYFIKNDDGTFSIATSENADFYYEQFTDGLSCLIFEKRFETPFYGFTRLGLQASFQAWLREYNCIKGNYGLKVTVEFSPEGSLTQEQQEPMIRELYLDTADMLGDPYSFETYYNQEKVFDITPYGGVSYIKIEFFQDAGSFINKNGEQIAYIDDFENLVFSNLFVKDCRVCLGYELTSYEDEFVQIFSFDANTYTSAASVEENKKDIELKWIHINEEGNQEIISNDSSYQYEIRWYRYILGEESADGYCGPSWTNPSHPRNKDVLVIESNPFYAHLNPDTGLQATEQIKAIILFGPSPGYSLQEKVTSAAFNANKIKYYIYENGNYINCKNLEYNDQQNYYTQNADTRRIFHSNILEFTNENDVISSATLDALQALTLVCKDEIDGKQYDSYGNYLLYDQSNSLIDKGQSQITRIIGCKLDLSSTEKDDTADLEKASSIIWRFPLKNTMISVIDDYFTDGDFGYIKITDSSHTAEQLTTHGMPFIRYTIASNYSPAKANNFIECSVEKDGITYHSIKELTFGQSGTAGTDWTFVIDFDKNINAIIPNSENLNTADITARLYNNSGQEEDITNKTIEWAFLDPLNTSKDRVNTNIQILDGDMVNRKTLSWNSNLSINDLYILRATIKDWEDYELTAYLPIPLRSSREYSYLTGATQVIYLTDGTPQYYTKYYEMHTINEDISDQVSFTSIYGNSNIEDAEKRYMPDVAIQKNSSGTILGYKLKPVSIYTEGLPIFGVQCQINGSVVWTQPVLIIQNRYPSAMINKWNGKDLVLDEENSVILSNMIGAGSKNDQNQFSGVLMGDWNGQSSANSSLNTYTGLFGFNSGELSYSLTDDGKATFGKSTAGQIIIDGNNSTIKSAGFNLPISSGMEIDLTENIILANWQGKEIFKLSGKSSDTNFLTITDPISNKVLMNVSNQNYFLQSSNYINSIETTTKINYAKLGAAYSQSTFNRWKNTYGTLYNANGQSISYSYGVVCYSKQKQQQDITTTDGSYFDLQSGYLEINRGTINGDVILNPNDGLKYQKYKASISYSGGPYGTWYDVVSNGEASLTQASLVSVLSDLYSIGERAIALGEAAGYNASAAQSLASYAAGIAETATQAFDRVSLIVNDQGAAVGDLFTAIKVSSDSYSYLTKYFGIGSASGTGTDAAIMHYGVNSVQVSAIGTSLAAGSATFSSAGGPWVGNPSVTSETTTTSASDKRLKENINYNRLKDYSKIFLNLKPVEFSYKKLGTNKKFLGFIAQDIEKLLLDNNLQSRGIVDEIQLQDGNYLTLNYDSLFTLTTYMLQEAYKEINQLKQEIQEIKEKTNE